MRAIRRAGAATLAAAIVVALGVTPAVAAPPSNDTEAGAVEITAVPSTVSADTSEATPGGPRFCPNWASVFYRFTPAEDAFVQVDTIGSDYYNTLGVYRRDEDGTIVRKECDYGRFGMASGERLHVHAGSTYYFMVGVCCGDSAEGGALSLTVTEVAQVELEVASQVTLPVTVDNGSGLATISGTVTCSERSVFYPYGMLRQLRQGFFVARGWYSNSVPCVPGAPVPWSVEVDTETSVAFGPGAALVRTRDGASDGWRDWLDLGWVDVDAQIVSS